MSAIQAMVPLTWRRGQLRSRLLWASGGAAFAVGALVYVTDRDSTHALLIPEFVGSAVHAWFGSVGGWLPSFVHPFSFALFSAAASARHARSDFAICAFWGLLNVAFECGQHPLVAAPIAGWLTRVAGDNSLARAVGQYLVRGRFDGADLFACIGGALAAAAVLTAFHSNGKEPS